jgi:membrane protease YdiL (CAAX protease family)
MKNILQKKVSSLLLLTAAFLMIYMPGIGFPYTFCLISSFVLLSIFLQDGNLQSLNFKKIGGKELKTIILCYLALELSIDFLIDPLINWICNESADYSMFSSIKGNTSLYLSWLMKMWISAAIGEELLFRAFTFSQMQRVIGDRKTIIVMLSALMFSLPHLYQGIPGLLSTFVFGIAFALIYAKFKNIWINIIVHGLVDTLFLTLSYLGLTEFYSLLW